MPTPTGMLRAGDHVRHEPTGRILRVVAREGNDAIYSVILTPADGLGLPRNLRQPIGHPGCFRLLEAAYHLGRTYTLVQPEAKETRP